MPLYALTVFVSAFLLFQVQPLIARYILPWFGGGPAVWTASMLFFQLLLLAGYAYAHLSIVRLKPRTQVIVHLVLLAVEPGYRRRGVGEALFRWLEKLAEEPMLLKMPLVRCQNRLSVGVAEKEWEEWVRVG